MKSFCQNFASYLLRLSYHTILEPLKTFQIPSNKILRGLKIHTNFNKDHSQNFIDSRSSFIDDFK